MDRNNPYYAQVQLLVRVLPFVFEETCFALKGGTAINLFVRDFPRLSVDIDLVYLAGGNREEALPAIRTALDRIADSIQQAGVASSVTRGYEQTPDALRLVVNGGRATIKIELSPVLRGTLHEPEIRSVTASVEAEFGFAEAPVVSLEDLYAGKLCAMLDRQHPRDYFDVMLLLENEGIDEHLRKAFLVYLVSHQRPMEELLAPNWRPIDAAFKQEFDGMAFREVTAEQLHSAAERAHRILLDTMTETEKQFLCSFYEMDPAWSLLELEGVADLPAVQWKLQNIEKMQDERRKASLAALRRALALND